MSSPAIGLRTIVADILCDQCQTPLIEVDLYGERLSGCTVCNKWGLPGDNHRVMELHIALELGNKVVPQEGFEPPTPALRMRCSTN